MTVQNDFSRGSIPGKPSCGLPCPLMLAQLVNILYNVVDRVFLGHIGGSTLPLTGRRPVHAGHHGDLGIFRPGSAWAARRCARLRGGRANWMRPGASRIHRLCCWFRLAAADARRGGVPFAHPAPVRRKRGHAALRGRISAHLSCRHGLCHNFAGHELFYQCAGLCAHRHAHGFAWCGDQSRA